MSRTQKAVIRWMAPAALSAGLFALAQGALAAPGPDVYDSLLPGRMTGTLTPYVVKKGDTLGAIATRFVVHPVRLYRPNAEALKDGLEYGETIVVDQRRVTPAFQPDVSGIVLNIPEAQVYLVKAGKLVTEYPVAVSTTDRRAPLGITRVVSMQKHPTWFVPPSIQKEMEEQGRPVKTKVLPGPDNPLGTRWIGFADGSFGFHGTIVPSSIKRYASHGCVRFLRPHIEDMYDRVKVGMPVRVLYQPVMMAVERQSIWLSVYPDIYKVDYDFKGAVEQLAKRAGVTSRIYWPAVDKAIKTADGIVTDVALASVPKPTPVPSVLPSSAPSAKPKPTPSALPSLAPSIKPTPTPTPVQTPASDPEPTPEPTSAPGGDE